MAAKTKPRGSIVWTRDTLTPNLKTAPKRVSEAVKAVMEYEANQAQNDMRTNAPWTDRTGNARQGLFARYFAGGGKGRDGLGRFVAGTNAAHVIVLYHTMPYGIWLEVKNSGEFGIILPTVQHAGQRTMKHVSQVLKVIEA